MKKEAVVNGFRMCGIYPLNVDNIHFDRCVAVAATEPTIISPTIAQTSDTATIIAIGNNENEVEAINRPTIDEIFIARSSDWDSALQIPFVIDSSDPKDIQNEVNVDVQKENRSDESSDSSRPSKILSKMKRQLEELREILPSERHEFSSTVVLMNQMCDFLIQNMSNETLVQSKIVKDLEQENQMSIFPNISIDSISNNSISSIGQNSLQTKTIADVLKRPPRPQRTKAHRNYGKLPKCGVMSSDEIVKQFEEDQREKENFKNKKQKRQEEITAPKNQIKSLKKYYY